jgi:hypothetical protein
MKTKFYWMVFICLFTLGVLYPGIPLQDRKEKRQNSLIMKELLIPPEKSLAPPKRNIFTRQRANSGANEFFPSGDFQSLTQTLGQKITPDQEKSAMEEARINVQYIGYVKSGKRVVALIILEGQTYAVESGDVLEMGVTIGEITPDDMEIIDQGSEPKRINLEGEKP